MNQDIFVSIIAELKDSHQKKVKRLEAKVKVYEMFNDYRLYNDIDDMVALDMYIRELISDASD